VGTGGERLPENSTVPIEVGAVAAVAAAAKGAILPRARSRMWRPVPGPPSCPVRSP
jgi:hypothetical protein